MDTHSGRSFLNSCLNVPIDPCNNCPAPIYNRPKVCVGRKLALTKILKQDSDNGQSLVETEDCASIRTLAKFYDSIPDYCEVNHLNGDEFYSTLDTLRSTSRELRTKTTILETCTSRSTTSLSTYCGLDKFNKKTTQKKKKTVKKKLPCSKRPPIIESTCTYGLSQIQSRVTVPSTVAEDYTNCLRGLSRLKSFKEEFTAEVADFKRSLKEYEEQFKRPISTVNSVKERPNSSHCRRKPLKTSKKDGAGDVPVVPKNVLESENPTTCTMDGYSEGEALKKSYSVNDLDNLSGINLTNAKSKQLIEKPKNFKTELSNYFASKIDLPKIKVGSPGSESSMKISTTGNSAHARRKKNKNKRTESAPPPLSWLYATTTDLTNTTMSTFPKHPVARPNLAATLRAQVARQKVEELKNNCTYHDTTPQVDWEVRKTPAWKSLALNEPHKAILSLRLATRKAEQALQRREYELHMELMRQRVKSAPLLLEGETFWSPDVGKLTHNCHREGKRHTCENKQRNQRRKCITNNYVCATVASTHCATAAALHGSAGDWHNGNKVEQLRTIYGCSLSHNKSKSNSRSSQRSSSGKRTNRSRISLIEPSAPAAESGDDLCSIDRAFL